MNTLDLLFGPDANQYWPGVVTAVLVGVLGAVLSPIVVLKRMAFIGQGVSHAAFGGVGIGLAMGLEGSPLAAVVVVFSIVAALAISWMSRRRETSTDTAIGIVIAASMAVGFLFFQFAEARVPEGTEIPELEEVLFGDVMGATWGSAAVAAGVLLAAMGVLWWRRRELVFWGFDETASQAFGVETDRVRTVLLVTLAVAIVVAVNLAGIVLATALFVLPAATALCVTDRLKGVWVWSVVAAVVSTAIGLVVSFESGWVTGPTVVLVMGAVFVVSRVLPGR